MINRVVVVAEIGHHQVEAPVAVVVAERQSHAPLLDSVFIYRHAEHESLLGEGAVMVVAIGVVGRCIIGDDEIGPAVVIQVRPHGPESIVSDRVVDFSRDRHVCEGPVAVVAVERVAGSGETAGAALDGNSPVLAHRSFAELRQVVQLECHVVGDEEIEIAIAVVIGPGGSRGEARVSDACFGGDVFEGPITAVTVKPIGAKTGDVQVVIAVIIIIRDRHSHRPSRVRHSCVGRHVLECPISTIAVERSVRSGAAGQSRFDRVRIYQIDIEPAVVVEVKQGNASAHALDNVTFVR